MESLGPDAHQLRQHIKNQRHYFANKGLFIVKAMPYPGNGNPSQYSCLENPMDGGDWWATVHGVAKSQTQLSNFRAMNFTFFSNAHGTFSRIDHILGHKSSLGKFKKKN